MLQIAVFVDAGYLYAQGSALLAGQKQPRNQVQLSILRVLSQLRSTREVVAPGTRLLRVYWYDGVQRGGRLSTEQSAIANSPYVKLRLGTVNSRGEQKGVDSLIVTDLIDLARNRVITDALILSGDEDIRVGVQVAQTYGVCVHLLGIKPARGSQSPDLVQEADTHREWTEGDVGAWMTVTPRVLAPIALEPTRAAAGALGGDAVTLHETLRTFVRDVVAVLAAADLSRHVAFLDLNGGRISPELDRQTLARLRHHIGRDLTDDERREYRRLLADALRGATRPT
jgi:uncharacterized LabA/DUF88 family protein